MYAIDLQKKSSIYKSYRVDDEAWLGCSKNISSKETKCSPDYCAPTTMADYYPRKEAMRIEKGRTDAAMEQYFEFIIYVYQQKLVDTFGDREAALLYDRTYMQFSTLWFCRNVISAFDQWFASYQEGYAQEDTDEAWSTLANIVDESIDNMIAFLAKIKKAHGKRNWLTGREGLQKALEVFVAATGDPPYKAHTFLVWDMINHGEWQCVATATLFVFIEEILGEWQEVRLGIQYAHLYVDGITELILSEGIPFTSNMPVCMAQYLYESDEGEEEVDASHRWTSKSMENGKFHLAYEGQSAFIFMDTIGQLSNRMQRRGPIYEEKYNIDYLTGPGIVSDYFNYAMIVLASRHLHRHEDMAPLMDGIVPAPFAGIEPGKRVTTREEAEQAVQQLVAQLPLRTQLNGLYGEHPIGTEHAIYLYYGYESFFFGLYDDEAYYFMNWVLYTHNVQYLTFYIIELDSSDRIIPVEMYIPCIENLPFYYWNYTYVFRGIAGMLHEEYEPNTIPPVLYTVPIHVASYILAVLRSLQGAQMTIEDVWELFTKSEDPLVPATEPVRASTGNYTLPLWEHPNASPDIGAYDFFDMSHLYKYLGKCYTDGTHALDETWTLTPDKRRQNPVYFAEVNAKKFSTESVAYYAKYSLWFQRDTVINGMIVDMFTEQAPSINTVQQEFNTAMAQADLSDAMQETILKLQTMHTTRNVPDHRKRHGWHPYIHRLYLSKNTESNLLMLTILLFIVKDSHPYFLEFMGQTKEEYISHKNKKVDLAIKRGLKKEQLERMGGMSMWDALQQFIE